MSKFVVVLYAEDGNYDQADFSSIGAAEAYVIANAEYYGDGQELGIEDRTYL